MFPNLADDCVVDVRNRRPIERVSMITEFCCAMYAVIIIVIGVNEKGGVYPSLRKNLLRLISIVLMTKQGLNQVLAKT